MICRCAGVLSQNLKSFIDLFNKIKIKIIIIVIIVPVLGKSPLRESPEV